MKLYDNLNDCRREKDKPRNQLINKVLQKIKNVLFFHLTYINPYSFNYFKIIYNNPIKYYLPMATLIKDCQV